MLANRVKETTTTTGTGNLTLAGAVTNFQTFNTAFGTARKFVYWIIDATNNVWETGIGYLSDSTTLVRETVKDNSSNGTTALSLSAGTKDVICAPAEASALPGMSFLRSGKTLVSRHIGGFSDTEDTLTANRLYLQPFLLEHGGSFDAFKVNVTTLIASSKARMGLWQVDPDGEPGALIVSSGDIDTTTTGLKTPTFTAVHLKPGWYFIGLLASHAIGIATITSGFLGETLIGRSSSSHFPVLQLYDTIAGGWSALPDPPVIDGTLGYYDFSFPMLMLRAA